MMDWNDNITDEMLAAYIDGNATPMEEALIVDSMKCDDLLAEAIDIVNDSMNMGDNLFSLNDMFSNSMNIGLENWFPSNRMDTFFSMLDSFNPLDGNDSLPPLSNDNDIMNNSLDLTNNEY